jgi:hypothetical protein
LEDAKFGVWWGEGYGKGKLAPSQGEGFGSEVGNGKDTRGEEFRNGFGAVEVGLEVVLKKGVFTI